MTAVMHLEDDKTRAVRKKWAYVARLCREAAEAASVDEDPAKVRRLLIRAAKHTAKAEQMTRTVHVVRGCAEDDVVVNATTNPVTASTTRLVTEPSHESEETPHAP